MSKLDKKKTKIQERISLLESELKSALTKKDSATKEIDIASHQRKVYALKKELLALK